MTVIEVSCRRVPGFGITGIGRGFSTRTVRPADEQPVSRLVRTALFHELYDNEEDHTEVWGPLSAAEGHGGCSQRWWCAPALVVGIPECRGLRSSIRSVTRCDE